jgi:hypothetical protein
MPLHAVTSTVRPAYYMYGQGGYQGATAITFPMCVACCLSPRSWPHLAFWRRWQVVREQLEAGQIAAPADGRAGADAAEGVGGQDGNSTVVYSGVAFAVGAAVDGVRGGEWREASRALACAFHFVGLLWRFVGRC